MFLNRYIRLKRGDRASIRQMMRDCEQALARGSSLFFFPEGTRSRTGQMRPFKPGAFVLAQQMQVPILPVVINGTRDALPKHSLNFHGRHHIQIRVLEAIPYPVFADLTTAQVAEMVRDRIASNLVETPPSTGHPSDR